MAERESTRQKGNAGETIVCDYLIREGYRILGRNVYVGHEEIDMICENDSYIVFVEVKTRAAYEGGVSRYGRPADAVNSSKRIHVASAASQYLREHPEVSESGRFSRIDVIEVLIHTLADSEPRGMIMAEIRHFPNAFGAGGKR